ncbi:MAG: nucleotide sugar dehydrogenase [Anaerolineaceae bacterium]|nr:nucleotide sugar dehydrogenase [Anaerolineaceae bacterium]
MTIDDLRVKIQDHSAKLAVIGLGYVGLPIAALFAEKGFHVTGVDVKKDRIQLINSGISPIEGKEPGLSELVGKVVKSGFLTATCDYQDIRTADIIFINVETPVNQDHIPEYKALRAAVKSLSNVLKQGSLVIIESTVMPGTMQDVVLPIIEQETSMQCGKDFYLGICPERVMPGKLLRNLRKMSRVAGGDSLETAELMVKLYRMFVEAEIDAADWITAEIVKTAENTYRDVQIAFANEVALICEALGADVWRVRTLIRKSPGREMLFPGAGVGGHCIPKDPWLLASSVKDADVPVRLIPAARAVNVSMPEHIFKLLKKHLPNLAGKKILILGYAYLSDSDDTRNSPSAQLVKYLKKSGLNYVIHDPYVKEYMGEIDGKAKDCDAVILMTAHSQYKSLYLPSLKAALKNPLIIDGRNLLDRDAVAKAGFQLVRLGDTSKK